MKQVMNMVIFRHRLLSIMVMVGVILLSFSCSQQVMKGKQKDNASPVYIGKIERVYARHQYVLISLSGAVYPPGTVLLSQSPPSAEQQRIANLIVTDERLGGTRIPADIRSGRVEAGDLVFLYRTLAAPESTESRKDEDISTPDDVVRKEDTPPVTPDQDGLLPLPGKPAIPVEPDRTEEDEKRISDERERILKLLDSMPDKLNKGTN